jgi:hypothetical protein
MKYPLMNDIIKNIVIIITNEEIVKHNQEERSNEILKFLLKKKIIKFSF